LKVLHNAIIYLLGSSETMVSAIAIDDGHIVAAGKDEEILPFAHSHGDKINLRGRVIFPGLADSHIHLEQYARSLQYIDCETTSKAECIRRVKEKVGKSAPGDWVIGHGWNQNNWPDGFGTSRELDEVSPGNPVYLTAKSLHAAWANTRAMLEAKIRADTPDPADGVIQRAGDGAPSGIIFEGAMRLISSVIPSPSPTELSELILQGQSNLHQLGVTQVHDMDGSLCFKALQILDEKQKLKLRVSKSILREDLEDVIRQGFSFGVGTEFLRTGFVKLFADGALGPHTAALLEPYDTDSCNLGILLLTEEEILQLGKKASQAGLPLAIHAIGDRANRVVLNAYAKLRSYELENQLSPLPHRIEHVQLIHPSDIPRLAALNITASMQPIHASSDQDMVDLQWGKRSAHAYPWNDLLRAGVFITFGSDCPVESPNPFWGIHAAVTRMRRFGTSPWHPEQKITLPEVLKAYISSPSALSNFKNCGRLIVGANADLIVLDINPFNQSPDDLHAIQPTATMVAGDWVYLKVL
jgi:predicted amidohydrolase YtcJ